MKRKKKAVETAWDGKSYGNRLGYDMFILCIRVLGVQTAYFILLFVVLYYFIFRPKSRASTLDFKKTYNRWNKARKKLGHFFFFERLYSFAQVIVDRVAIFACPKNPFRLVYDGLENLDQLASQGGILLGAHIGNWETGLSFLNHESHIRPVVAMVRVEGDLLQEFLTQKGGEFITIIPLDVKEHEKNMFLMKTHLEKGEVVAMHGDRFFGKSRTVQVNFLGRPALFPIGPYLLAATMERSLCFVHVLKVTHLTYRLVCSKPKKYSWDPRRSREEQIEEWVTEYVRFLEEYIGRYPDQWFNFYHFWD